MSLTLDKNNANFQIRAFKPGFIQINNTVLTKSIVITPNQLIDNWEPQNISHVTPEHLAIFITLRPTILLIGTGRTLHLLPIELYGELLNNGIGVEIMNTGAACRTFNALTAEGRNVAAALMLE